MGHPQDPGTWRTLCALRGSFANFAVEIFCRKDRKEPPRRTL